MKVKKAVIPCGGLGTRFLPITKAVAKEMLPIIDKPAIDYIVDEMVAADIEDIMLIISPGKDIMRQYYSPNNMLNSRLSASGKTDEITKLQYLESKANICYAIQTEPKGSSDALLLAEDFIAGEPFAIAWGDDVIFSEVPVIKQLAEIFDQYQKPVIGVQTRGVPDILKYGVIDINEDYGNGVCLINGIMEKPKDEKELKSKLAALGRYVVTPDIFEFIRRTEVASNGELQFTDTLNLMSKHLGVMSYDFKGRRYDLGDKLGMLEAVVEYGLRHKTFGSDFKDYLKKLLKKD